MSGDRKVRRHLMKARLTVLGEYEPSSTSAVAICSTLDVIRDPFQEINKQKTATKDDLYRRIRELHAQGLRRQQIQRELLKGGIETSLKTISRALNPKD
jgi:hypothetical protein